MNKHTILEWYNDHQANINDTYSHYYIRYARLLDGTPREFHEYLKETYQEFFMNEIVRDCSKQLGLPYDEVYAALEDDLKWK